jgi:hypothetical protein
MARSTSPRMPLKLSGTAWSAALTRTRAASICLRRYSTWAWHVGNEGPPFFLLHPVLRGLGQRLLDVEFRPAGKPLRQQRGQWDALVDHRQRHDLIFQGKEDGARIVTVPFEFRDRFRNRTIGWRSPPPARRGMSFFRRQSHAIQPSIPSRPETGLRRCSPLRAGAGGLGRSPRTRRRAGCRL